MSCARLLQTILLTLAVAAGGLAQNAAANGPVAPGDIPPLFSAIEGGDLKTLARLLAAGANPNARNKGGDSPLGFAAERGRLAEARLLVAHGADIQAPDGGVFAFTPLIAAAREGQVDLVDWLLGNGANALQTDRVFGYTALLWAVKAGKPKAVRRLIAKDGDANRAEGSHGETPLRLAAKEGRTGMMALLLELGAGIDRPGGPEGEPPLNAAIRAGEEAAAEWLIDHGANPNAKSRVWRTTPLMAAAKAGLHGTRLIDHGAKVDPAQEGESPLALAVLGGHREVARLLVERGTDIDRKGPGSHSPRDRARGWEWNFDALEQKGATK